MQKETNLEISCCVSTDGEIDDDYYKPIEGSDIGELGLTEDHFSKPEGYFGFSTSEELKMAISDCKEMILSPDADQEKRKHLVSKLVQLKLKLLELKEAPKLPPDTKVFLGHCFEVRSLERPHQYCEKCCGIIWGMMTNWYLCKNCGFKCHNKCLNLITRICARTKVIEKGSYELSICPEVGLSQQKFRCAECKERFIFKSDRGWSFYDKKRGVQQSAHSPTLPRLCDYNGLYYCSHCHWNSTSVVPARVICNWDFSPQKVCRASLQFLRLMLRKPILNLESLNAPLFAHVTELGQVKKLRCDVLLMKKYLLTCHTASEEKLLLQLKDRQHFVEGPHMYSLQDLVDVSNGTLLDYLNNIHSAFITHITQQCQSCRGKGFICEICNKENVIFPFDPRTEICDSCSSVFHQECRMRWEGPCPKCSRKRKLSGLTNS